MSFPVRGSSTTACKRSGSTVCLQIVPLPHSRGLALDLASSFEQIPLLSGAGWLFLVVSLDGLHGSSSHLTVGSLAGHPCPQQVKERGGTTTMQRTTKVPVIRHKSMISSSSPLYTNPAVSSPYMFLSSRNARIQTEAVRQTRGRAKRIQKS